MPLDTSFFVGDLFSCEANFYFTATVFPSSGCLMDSFYIDSFYTWVGSSGCSRRLQLCHQCL